MLTAKVAAGELVVKKRKQRSDKEKMRGKGDKKAAAEKVGKCVWDNKGGGSAGDEDDDGEEQEPRQPPKKN